MIGPLPYIGGKNRLASKIIALFPEHTTYVEAFAGGAQVIFRKKPSRVEVLNDLDFDVVNFFRVLRLHHREFIHQLRYALISRRTFEIWQKTDPETLTDIQRAVRFFYLQKNCFGGRVVRPSFHYGVTHPSNFNPRRIQEIVSKVYERLQRVQIESLPYEEILRRYDRPTTLFYLDPPYWQRELYRQNFSEEDFIALEKRLHGLKGKFILSLNDAPEVRRLFRSFHIRATGIAYTAQTTPGKRYSELLIMNFSEHDENAV